jgi:hypothetical protein
MSPTRPRGDVWSTDRSQRGLAVTSGTRVDPDRPSGDVGAWGESDRPRGDVRSVGEAGGPRTIGWLSLIVLVLSNVWLVTERKE